MKKKSILLIDSNRERRTLCIKVLRENEFEVITRSPRRLDLASITALAPAIVLCEAELLLDLGKSQLSEIYANRAAAMTSCIAMTSKTGKTHLRNLLSVDVDDLLISPFKGQDLLASIERCCERRERLLNATEQRLEEIRVFFTMSLPHELRTPLNGISGNSELLIDHIDLLSNDEVKAIARDIKASSSRLNRVFNNFLTYSQIEFLAADPARLDLVRRRRTSQLGEVLEVLAKLTSQHYKRESDLEMRLNSRTLAMSEEYVRKVFGELLDNAFKFSKAGTRVRFVTKIDGRRLSVAVEDEGRGMSPAQIARIGANIQFERRQYEQQGTGMGLVIAKRLVELHRGKLQIESHPDSGTRVEVMLPLGK
ncbi:MAG: ATP-binding protein [Calditrichia bacterium]